jgi:hypothetical protein
MTITSGESIQFSNISATTAQFQVKGGYYAITVHATFGGGNVQLQTLALDGSTWLLMGSSITADGTQIYQLPPGPYRIAIATATGVYAALTRVPL